MNYSVSMHRKHRLLNGNCSSKHGISLFEILVRASPDDSKIAKDIAISLGYPP